MASGNGQDLYEYPSDHVGRKVYVSVRGHTRSVPKFKTYLGSDRRNYLLPEYGGDWSGMGGGSTFIMPDKPGYLSPLDGKYVEGRSAHRDHMKRHNVLEAGDMKVGEFAGRENSVMPRVGYDVKRAIEELRSR